jgi:hypothetical protein
MEQKPTLAFEQHDFAPAALPARSRNAGNVFWRAQPYALLTGRVLPAAPAKHSGDVLGSPSLALPRRRRFCYSWQSGELVTWSRFLTSLTLDRSGMVAVSNNRVEWPHPRGVAKGALGASSRPLRGVVCAFGR